MRHTTAAKQTYNPAYRPTTSSISAINSVLVCTFLLSAISAHAAVTVVPPAVGATTVIEQDTQGNITTITADQNGISMKNGMPYAVAQVQTTTPTIVRSVAVDSPPVVISPAVNTTAPVSPVGTPTVITTSTVTTPITTPVIVAQTAPVLTTQSIPLNSVQLIPSFNKPGVVSADTKLVKIMQDAAGKEFAAPINTLTSGDIIEYHITYTNTTNSRVNNIIATANIPNTVQIISLKSPVQTLAITENTSNYQIVSKVGNTAIMQVTAATPLNTYTGLQWQLTNLAPNARKDIMIRAQVK